MYKTLQLHYGSGTRDKDSGDTISFRGDEWRAASSLRREQEQHGPHHEQRRGGGQCRVALHVSQHEAVMTSY